MKIKQKFIFLVTILMSVSMLFSVTGLASGVETWSGAWKTEPKMTIQNYNVTPEKTMGVSGTLHIAASIKGRPDLEPSGCPKVKLTVQIRDLNGKVLAKGSVREDAFMPQVHLSYGVKKGQKIKIYFDISSVSTNPNGNYRWGDVTYSHEIY